MFLLGLPPRVVPDIKGPLNGYVCACSLVVHAFGAVWYAYGPADATAIAVISCLI